MSVDIRVGDCLDVLRTLPDESVQCCVTSPPYFGLRDYGVAGQIGLEATPELFVAKMVEVFREVRRVLADDGTLWLNLGDSYANDAKWGGRTGGKHAKGLHAAGGLGREKRATGLPPKSLMLIPARVAIAMQGDGWILRSEIIWQKPNPMPEAVTDRPTRSHETLFLFAKQPRYFYDADAIAERMAESSVERPSQPSIDDQAGSVRANGGTRPTRPMKAVAGPSWQERKAAGATAGNIGASETYQRGVHGKGLSHNLGMLGVRNKRTVWTVSTVPFRDAHFATFPPKLIEPCILAGSRPGDTVLDPFGGAGTTGLVASRNSRKALLIELNPQYAELARKRIHDDAPLFADGAA